MTTLPNTNDEYLAQTDQDIFFFAQESVTLAFLILSSSPDAEEKAIEVLLNYGDWRSIAGLDPRIVSKLKEAEKKRYEEN